MKRKKEPYVRINSRISSEQLEYIKSYAKNVGATEGEIHRTIIDFFIKNEAKKPSAR